MFFSRTPTAVVDPADALPGRDVPMPVPPRHEVLDAALTPPWPEGSESLVVGMGCFWGAERIFWQLPGVVSTAVGYSGGTTPNPTYEEVCSGMTGHTEAVLVVYRPDVVSTEEVLATFWEGHDPTQGMAQGNDVGTQYRSALYWHGEDQQALAESTRDRFARRLSEAGYGPITTEVAERGEFFYAEEYHQQYLHKVPNGYCGIGGTGVTCPVGPLAS